jgi:hypothetical protein
MTRPTFSQREGLKPLKIPFQLKTMDKDLRTSLWNLIMEYVMPTSSYVFETPYAQGIWKHVYSDLFKKPLDELPALTTNLESEVKKLILSIYDYNEVYDLIEFLANDNDLLELKEYFIKRCNVILQRESAGYHFVSGKIIRITSKEEIETIESAGAGPLSTVNLHMERALTLLSDRTNPDYRNSIKESVSAVEALCQKITGRSTATLGEALDLIAKQGKISLPQALRLSFDKIYGYSSSSHGIRHALSGVPTLNYDDAKYMLVSCSAFVNYLITKAEEAGIKLN